MATTSEVEVTEIEEVTTSAPKRSLLDHHIIQLEQSGLTRQTIEAAGLFSVIDPEEARTILNWSSRSPAPPVPALAIPYEGVGDYIRLRPDVPRTSVQEEEPDVGGHRYHVANDDQELEQKTSGPKYESPRGKGTRLYVPRTLRPEIFDADQRLWLVEGEKKCLAACQSGLAAVAAPGVQNFHNAAWRWESKGGGKDERALHPDLARIPLKGREVVICFDSDIDSNDKVLKAAVALNKMLDAAGADVHIAYIDGEVGRKIGLDDFLGALPDEEKQDKYPLGAIEDSVRPFNVVACLEGFLHPDWADWGSAKQHRELGRAVRLAAAMMKGHDLEHWMKDCQRLLRVKVGDLKIHLPPKPVPPSVRRWFGEWAERNQLTFSYGTEVMTLRGQKLSAESIVNELLLDAQSAKAGSGERMLQAALGRWQDEKRDEVIAAHKAKLAFQPNLGDAELRRWVRAVTGAEDEVDVAVMKHFIWQVKRKLHDLPVQEHLMPVIFGPQRIGKTEAVKRLLGPIQEISDPSADMSFLKDGRELFRLATFYAVFFDEMANADRADVNILKQRISSDVVRWRMMRTTRLASAPNVATFIGATNTEIGEMLYDPTGLTRFYQLDAPEKLDWDAINSIDYGALWASVDHQAELPIKPVLKELRECQEDVRPKDSVEIFYEEVCKTSGYGVDGWTKATVVYEKYREYAKDGGFTGAFNQVRFAKRFKALLLRDMGGEGTGWKTSNGKWYAVKLTGRDMTTQEKVNETLEQYRATRGSA